MRRNLRRAAWAGTMCESRIRDEVRTLRPSATALHARHYAWGLLTSNDTMRTDSPEGMVGSASCVNCEGMMYLVPIDSIVCSRQETPGKFWVGASLGNASIVLPGLILGLRAAIGVASLYHGSNYAIDLEKILVRVFAVGAAGCLFGGMIGSGNSDDVVCSLVGLNADQRRTAVWTMRKERRSP